MTGERDQAAASDAPAQWVWVAVALVLNLVACLALLSQIGATTSLLDLRVFLGATDALLNGGDLYSFSISQPGGPTPFLYPPFAAMVFAGLSRLPIALVAAVWTSLQLGLVVLLIWLSMRGSSLRLPWLMKSVTVLVSWALVVSSFPMLDGLILGQVGILLASLVFVDALLVPPRWRGILTGVAGAIKLVPLFMLTYYVVTKQWRAAQNLLFGFGAATGLAFAVWPSQSWTYWSQYAFSTGRFPGIGSDQNVSLLGILQFLRVDSATPFWVVGSAVVLGVGLPFVHRLHRAREDAAAVVLAGMMATLISPVSWYHHLVWLPLVGIVLLSGSVRSLRPEGWLLLCLLSSSLLWATNSLSVTPVFYFCLQIVALGLLGVFAWIRGRDYRATEPEGTQDWALLP